MTTHSSSSNPPPGLGLSSVILGAVGILLFFLPVLSIPVGAVGLAFGIFGFLLGILGNWTSLRWSLVGIVVSGLAVGLGVLIALAPSGYLPSPKRPRGGKASPIGPTCPRRRGANETLSVAFRSAKAALLSRSERRQLFLRRSLVSPQSAAWFAHRALRPAALILSSRAWYSLTLAGCFSARLFSSTRSSVRL